MMSIIRSMHDPDENGKASMPSSRPSFPRFGRGARRPYGVGPAPLRLLLALLLLAAIQAPAPHDLCGDLTSGWLPAVLDRCDRCGSRQHHRPGQDQTPKPDRHSGRTQDLRHFGIPLANASTLADDFIAAGAILELDYLPPRFTVDWYCLAAGGASSATPGGRFAISSTIGQAAPNPPAAQGRFELSSGYWALVGVVQTVGAPLLTSRLMGAQVRVSWISTPDTAWKLQQTSHTPDQAVWSDAPYPVADDGVERSVLILAPNGRAFFRLIR